MNLRHFLFALLVLSVSAEECKDVTKHQSLADPSVVRAASLALESLSCDIYISTAEHKLTSTVIRKRFLLLMSARRKAVKKEKKKKRKLWCKDEPARV